MRPETVLFGGAAVLAVVAIASAIIDGSEASAATGGAELEGSFTYALQDGVMNRSATYAGDASRGVMIFGGQSVACHGVSLTPSSVSTYATNVTATIATMAYVVLAWFQRWGAPKGAELAFDLEKRSFIARLAIHNDGPNGPRPFDHWGVDLFEVA